MSFLVKIIYYNYDQPFQYHLKLKHNTLSTEVLVLLCKKISVIQVVFQNYLDISMAQQLLYFLKFHSPHLQLFLMLTWLYT